MSQETRGGCKRAFVAKRHPWRPSRLGGKPLTTRWAEGGQPPREGGDRGETDPRYAGKDAADSVEALCDFCRFAGLFSADGGPKRAWQEFRRFGRRGAGRGETHGGKGR